MPEGALNALSRGLGSLSGFRYQGEAGAARRGFLNGSALRVRLGLACRVHVGLPGSSLLAFLRLVTNPRASSRSEPIGLAWQQGEEWLECESVWTPEPSERHREILGQLIAQVSPTGNLISDTYLAALALDHGLILASTDGDFARFPGLRWENPIERQGVVSSRERLRGLQEKRFEVGGPGLGDASRVENRDAGDA